MHALKFGLWEWSHQFLSEETGKSLKCSRLQKPEEVIAWEEVPQLSVKLVGNGRTQRNVEILALISYFTPWSLNSILLRVCSSCSSFTFKAAFSYLGFFLNIFCISSNCSLACGHGQCICAENQAA